MFKIFNVLSRGQIPSNGNTFWLPQYEYHAARFKRTQETLTALPLSHGVGKENEQVQLNKVAKMQIYCTQNNQDVTYVLNAANIYFVGIDENNSVLKLFGVANNQDILLNQQDGQRFGILKSIFNNKYAFERG